MNNGHLPRLARLVAEDLQKKGLVMHYHASMSKEYLTKVYEDFSKEDGHCRILYATEEASTVRVRYASFL